MTKFNIYKKWLIPLFIGFIILVMLPFKPSVLSNTSWETFALFITLIVSFITQPIPIGALAIVGLTIAMVSNLIDIKTALLGFGNPSIWLILLAFFISEGFIKTGLGRRIALIFTKWFGKSTLKLSYSLLAVDLILSPAMPSTTARSGGVVFPIIKSLAHAMGSEPDDKSRKKIGTFLIYSEFQGSVITSTMFLTSMAGNPLAQSLASNYHVTITWMNWFLAALVPGIISLIFIPWLIYRIFPPTQKKMPKAKSWAQDQLKIMGKMSHKEICLAIIFIIALVLWISGSAFNISATLVAFIALSLILLTNVLTWNDVISQKGAWNTFIWFSVMVLLATQLSTTGFITWLSKIASSAVKGLNWLTVLALLLLIYFYIHYLFASATAQVSAMYLAFLGIAISSGAPATLAAMLFAFFSNISGSTTHYGWGPAPIFYGSGYVTQKEWWSFNAVIGAIYIIIWGVIGSLWMKIIGLW